MPGMSDYKMERDSQNRWLIYEDDKIVYMTMDKKRANEVLINLRSGGGFNGLTPDFMKEKDK